MQDIVFCVLKNFVYICHPKVVYIGLLLKIQMKKSVINSKICRWVYFLFLKDMPMLLPLLLLTFHIGLNAQITQANPNAIYSSADALLFKNSDKKQDTPSQKSITQDNIIHIIGDAIVYNLENIIIKQEPYKGKEKKEIPQKILFTKKTITKKRNNYYPTPNTKNKILFPSNQSNSYFTIATQVVAAIQNQQPNKTIYTIRTQCTQKTISSAIVIKNYRLHFTTITNSDTSSIRPPPYIV